MALRIRCDGCGTSVITDTGADPDGALDCGCCPQDHHHGEAANACPGHPGKHGKGVPGCTVCRPLTITALAGTFVLRPAEVA